MWGVTVILYRLLHVRENNEALSGSVRLWNVLRGVLLSVFNAGECHEHECKYRGTGRGE